MDVREFIRQYNDTEMDTNSLYQFDAEPYDTALWGLDADRKDYMIYIADGTNAGFLLLTTSSIANSIKDSKKVTFTVRIDPTSTISIDPIYVVSAVPK